MGKPTLLIDGDLILFKATAAVEKDVRFDEFEQHILFSDPEDAWANVQAAVERLFDRFDTDKHVIALSEGRNFRYDIDPSYKCNRAGQRKPLCYTAVRERCEAAYTCFKHPGIEADDVLGIFATRDPNTVIVSEDKDIKTIPCTLFAQGEVRKYTVAEADYWHLYQTLIGDTADGYKGCPGVGPKKAEALLTQNADDPEDNSTPWRWARVVAAYVKAGLTEEDALRQARLARILRNSDWDAEKKQPILWSPNGPV